MKFRKLLVSALTGCLFMGASGAAMAQDNFCDRGFIANETVNGNLIVDQAGCSAVDVIVLGNVIVTDSPRFFIQGSRVTGRIVVKGGRDTGIVETLVSGGNVAVRNTTGDTILSGNIVKGAFDMRIIKTGGEALIYENDVGRNLVCRNNGAEAAIANVVGGTNNCAAP